MSDNMTSISLQPSFPAPAPASARSDAVGHASLDPANPVGAKHAFVASMYESQATSLVKHLYRKLHDADEALEVAHEAWLRLMNHRAPEGLENARAFLFQTANNLVIDRARHAAVEQRYLAAQAGAELSKVGPTAERQYLAREELNTLVAALDELPPATREAFMLHRFSGLSYLAIADALGVSSSMVEKHVIRALKALRAAVLTST